MTKADKLKSRQAKRQSLIVSMQRLAQFAKDYTPQQQQQIPDRLDRLSKIWECFQMVQEDCEEWDDSENATSENEALLSQAEELYFETKAALTSYIPETTDQVKEEVTRPANVSVKLPIISLPEFCGELTEWLSFYDTFVSLVHNSEEISNIQKFHYLRASLKREAAGIIQPIPITAENYQVAWKALLNRYSNKVHLRKMHTRALFELPKLTNSHAPDLRQLANQFQLHIDILKQLEESIPDNSTIYVELLATKLDKATLQAWEEHNSQDIQPTHPNMTNFLLKRAQTIEALALQTGNRPTTSHSKMGIPNHKFSKKMSTNTISVKQDNTHTCPACKKDGHTLHQCQSFIAMPCKARQAFVSQNKLCINCLRSGHFFQQCPSKYYCRICKRKHHSILHYETQTNNNPESESTTSESNIMATLHTISSEHSPQNVLLATVLLQVVDKYGQKHFARALLDNGSQPNAISERLCQQLHLTRKNVNVSIVGVDGTKTSARYQIQAEVQSRINNFATTMNFLVLKKVASDTPITPVPAHFWNVPASYQLADPHFSTPGRIDMIIGAGHFYSLLGPGRQKLPNNNQLVETVFGWIMTGNIPSKNQNEVTCHVVTMHPTIEEQIERFWKIDELHNSSYSLNERECENHFKETVSRDHNGRYIVEMPKHPDITQMLGDSKNTAMRRFQLLEKRLESDTHLKAQYHKFIHEYITLGHMTLVPREREDCSGAFYLPHHPVLKDSSSTTKVRVVFDGSAKTSTGKSLNDALLVGPVVQEELLTLIIRFRKYEIALIADIEKMYRQVTMNPTDRHLQRILWRFDNSQPIRTYELGTVTYGLAPSAFLATRTLIQLANDEGDKYLKARSVIKENVYVDDLLAGANNIPETIELRNQLNALLQKSGFLLPVRVILKLIRGA